MRSRRRPRFARPRLNAGVRSHAWRTCWDHDWPEVILLAPLFLLGGYLLFGAVYCYRKGDSTRTGTVKRTEGVIVFTLVICAITLLGFVGIIAGIHALMRAAR